MLSQVGSTQHAPSEKGIVEVVDAGAGQVNDALGVEGLHVSPETHGRRHTASFS